MSNGSADWVEWDGSQGAKRPVSSTVWVEYKTRNGYNGSRAAGWLAWQWGDTEKPTDIVAYRVEEELIRDGK